MIAVMADFHVYATLDVTDHDPGIEVVDLSGFLANRSVHEPRWAARPDGGYDFAALDADLEALGYRRVGDWQVNPNHAFTLADRAR